MTRLIKTSRRPTVVGWRTGHNNARPMDRMVRLIGEVALTSPHHEGASHDAATRKKKELI